MASNINYRKLIFQGGAGGEKEDCLEVTIPELGAGTSLPGVVAAKCGAKVILSDARQFPRCLENCKRSCQANDLQDVDVVGITWGDFSRELFELPTLDFIVASDCFYDTKDFEDVLATVYFLLDRNPDARFLCTYQERNSDWSIEFLLNKWQLQCLHISLPSFEADSQSIAQSNLPGNHTIWMLEMTTEEMTKKDMPEKNYQMMLFLKSAMDFYRPQVM
ncbi:histone-arginine methyltransferase METTL23-like isoform X3 [Ptychodera flava]|uniref:histone-arginine methyltransferase METTL23-like isoform X3 n=1 Tax=Ptychodera flava TaxID=63121 RepID=UPI003969F651